MPRKHSALACVVRGRARQTLDWVAAGLHARVLAAVAAIVAKEGAALVKLEASAW